MNMPLADVLDRLSICNLKKYVGKQNTDTERDSMVAAVQAYKPIPPKRWYTQLQIFNAMIWANESAIRDAKKVKKLSVEEVGRRALAIRRYNKERMKVKAEIAKWAGETVDKKVQHASE